MLDSLYIASTSLHAEQANINGISNNLANVNTPAFKKNRVIFDDLMYRQPINTVSASGLAEQNVQMGLGSSIVDNSKVFTAGDLKASQNDLDIAIRGQGFFELEAKNGDSLYTRLGALRIGQDGYLETKSGYRLADRIQIPPDASKITIGTDGHVLVTTASEAKPIDVGTISLVNFLNDSGLESLGDGVYRQTDKSGPPLYGTPGKDGMGSIQQGFLEASNVDLVEELTELVLAQRTYQVNSQVIRASDEIMKMTNNLRG